MPVAFWSRTGALPLVARLTLCLVLALLAPSFARAEARLALIIGNDNYQALPVLAKARNDARAVAGTLQGIGLSVTLIEDADRRRMTRALSDLAAAITPGDEVLFYYAGHGVEVSGRNYLLPVDAPPARPGDEAFLTAESVAVDDILFTLQSRGARVMVLILDACRDNPFPRQGTRSAGGVRGLAAVTAPEGAFILFSACTGQAALDSLGPGDGNPNSVFTRALLPLLSAPGLPMQRIARSLKAEVEGLAQTVNHKQRPAYYDELTGDFVLNAAGTRGAAPLEGAAPAAAPAPSFDPCDAAARDWQRVGALEDKDLLHAFAEAHRDCPVFAGAATQRAQAIDIARGAGSLGNGGNSGGIAASPGGAGIGVAPGGTGIGASPGGAGIGVAPGGSTPAPPRAPAPPVQTWRVKMGVSDGYMNARSGPGTTYPILFQIPEGTGGLLVEGCRKPDKGGGSRDVCLTTWGTRQGWVSIGGLEKE